MVDHDDPTCTGRYSRVELWRRPGTCETGSRVAREHDLLHATSRERMALDITASTKPTKLRLTYHIDGSAAGRNREQRNGSPAPARRQHERGPMPSARVRSMGSAVSNVGVEKMVLYCIARCIIKSWTRHGQE
jgi:hypothetical protein